MDYATAPTLAVPDGFRPFQNYLAIYLESAANRTDIPLQCNPRYIGDTS
jgi:hypothetical protein